METILLPLDGSALAERALGFGAAFARAFDAQLRLLHILEEPIAVDLLPSLLIPDRAAAEAYLQRVAKRMPDDVRIDTMVLRGYAGEALVNAAANEPDAMLVMSTHGRGGISRALLGSIADDVLRHATVPVALVREAATAPADVFQSILVPLDSSHYGETALPLAVQIATQCGASISLVNVCEPFWDALIMNTSPEMGAMNYDMLEAAQQEVLTASRAYLHRLANEVCAKGLEVSWEVRKGRPIDEILLAVEAAAADLIVIATHGRGGLSRLAFGSVTNAILQHSTVPILAIPPMLLKQRERDVEALLSTY